MFVGDVPSIFLLLAGFIIGLGAVTVIDLLGFLGRKSKYWTEATTRTHHVTKPLIWVGLALAIVGGVLFYRNESFSGIPMYHAIIAVILILNGFFLSFRVSPYLNEREDKGRGSEILPKSWQYKITASFLVSFIGWWSSVLLFVWYLVNVYAA